MSLTRIGLAAAICATASLWASTGPASAVHILPTKACDTAADIPAGCFIGGGQSSAFRSSLGTPLTSFTTPAISKPATPAVIVLFVDENNDGDFNDAGEAKGAAGTPAETLLGPQALGGAFRLTYAQGAGTNPRLDFVTCHADEQGLHVRITRVAGSRDVDVEFQPTGTMTWTELTPTQTDAETNPEQGISSLGFCVNP